MKERERGEGEGERCSDVFLKGEEAARLRRAKESA